MLFFPIEDNGYTYPIFLFSRVDPNSICIEKVIKARKYAEENSYGEKLLIQMLKPCFTSVTNLRDEYLKYYLEYSTFTEFLYKKLLFDKDQIEQLIEMEAANGVMYYGFLKYGMDYTLAYEATNSENLINMINDIIKDIDNEN